MKGLQGLEEKAGEEHAMIRSVSEGQQAFLKVMCLACVLPASFQKHRNSLQAQAQQQAMLQKLLSQAAASGQWMETQDYLKSNSGFTEIAADELKVQAALCINNDFVVFPTLVCRISQTPMYRSHVMQH